MAIDYKSAPFDEAISYLENRIALPSERWNDYKDSETDAAFWSAGAVDATLVSDLQKAVTRAIQNGTPYDSPEFANLIQNFSTDYGWDIKGGADWRARLILTQNLRQAYAAGRQQQQFDPDVMKLQPYVQYQHSDSRTPRPAHLALDGKVFRKDDPILGSIYPPNGFNCGCYMTSLSERQLAKKGLEVESIALGDQVAYTDENGQTKQAIIAPDKGFNAMPNASSAEQRAANLKVIKERLPKSWGERIDSAIASLSPPKVEQGYKDIASPSPPARQESSQKSTVQIRDADLENNRSALVAQFGEELVSSAEANTQKIINNSDVMIRVPVEHIDSILAEGKMLNSAEITERKYPQSGKKTEEDDPWGDLEDPDEFEALDYQNTRNQFEKMILGIPMDTPASQRPIYGYAGNSSDMYSIHQKSVENYGDVAFKLKSDVKDRASINTHDSFDGRPSAKANDFNAGSFASVDAFKNRSGLDRNFEKVLNAASESKSIDEFIRNTSSPYLEYQIQGGVQTSDIAEMHYTNGKEPSANTIKWAKENGVKIFKYDRP